MTDHPLKPGWQTYRFDQIAVNVNDRVEPGDVDVDYYVGLEHLDPDSLRIRRWGSPDDVEATKLQFKKGDIIFGRRRVYQRKLGVADFDGICSAHAMVLRPKKNVVLPEFLPFFMQSDLFMNRALEISVGSLSPTINWKTLAKEEFALPPLEEQRKLALALKASVDTEEKLTELIEQSLQLQKSFLNDLFFYKGEHFQEYGRFRVPPDWQLLTLPELVVNESNSSTAGPFGTIFKAKDFRPEGVPILQIRHVTDDGFRFDDKLTFMDVGVYERIHKPYTVHPGDLLITKMGEPPGLACLYPEDAPIAMVTPDVIKATLNKGIICPEYAVHVFNNQRARANVLRLCKGGTRTRVSLGELYQLRWPVPGISEQLEILKIVNPLVETRKNATERKNLLQALRGKLMLSQGI